MDTSVLTPAALAPAAVPPAAGRFTPAAGRFTPAAGRLTGTAGPFTGTAGRGQTAVCRPVGLTARERLVLAAMAQGMSNDGIADAMYLSTKTVEAHIGAIFCKLGLAPADGNRRVLAVVAWMSGTVR